MEPNALTHAAGYEFLVPLMDSEDITALPSLSGTSLGQSEHQAAACNHGDRRTRTDRSVLREKWPEFEYTHVPVLAKERYKKPVKLCWTVHSYTVLTPCQHVRCLFYFSSTLWLILQLLCKSIGTHSAIPCYRLSKRTYLKLIKYV